MALCFCQKKIQQNMMRSRFMLFKRSIPPDKLPPFSPKKRIGEVLKECREFDTHAEIEDYKNKLDKFRVRTAVDWHKLPDAEKEAIKKDGLHQTVITSLNDAVRVGLLLPAFKYADKVAFLKEGDHHEHDEVQSIIAYAYGVDAKWILERTECQTLCEEIRAMLELTQKDRLKRWSLYACDDGPFPKTHNLSSLHKILRQNIPLGMSVAGCPHSSLRYVTQCGEFTRYKGAIITCSELFEHMKYVDPYVLNLWKGMQTAPVR